MREAGKTVYSDGSRCRRKKKRKTNKSQRFEPRMTNETELFSFPRQCYSEQAPRSRTGGGGGGRGEKLIGKIVFSRTWKTPPPRRSPRTDGPTLSSFKSIVRARKVAGNRSPRRVGRRGKERRREN